MKSKFLDTRLIEAVQVIFNIFDQLSVDKLFPFSMANDTVVIVRVHFEKES